MIHSNGWSQTFSYDSDDGVNPWDGMFDLSDIAKYAYGSVYLMRLNRETSEIIEGHLAKSLPCDFDPERTISLPIRASDKCIDNGE